MPQQQQQQPHPVDPDVRARIHAFLFESAQASSSSTAAAATTHDEEAKCVLCQYEFENGDSMKSVPLRSHAFLKKPPFFFKKSPYAGGMYALYSSFSLQFAARIYGQMKMSRVMNTILQNHAQLIKYSIIAQLLLPLSY